MAANQNVIDELVVKLTLDADQYKKADQLVINLVNKTEVSLKDADAKETKRQKAAQKRNKDTLKGVKELALGIRSLALTVGGLLGVGSAAGLVGAVVALAGMETGLRRAAVSTGLSNRELQAYGGTMRRLGADATAGAQAIADLAREQKQAKLGVPAPTLAALTTLGVRAGPNTNIVDMLAQAQQVYHAAPKGQQENIEATLAANGVSPDLIVAIKSEKDVREEFARSYAESTTENSKALDAVTDGLTAASNAATSAANSIATIFAPQIKEFSQWVSDSAKDLSVLADKVALAGGGIDGLQKVLDAESPELGQVLHTVRDSFTFLAQAVDLATFGLKLISEGAKSLFDWVDKKLSFLTGGGGNTHPLAGAVQTVKDALVWAWKGALEDARVNGVTHLSDATKGVKLSSGASRRLSGAGFGSPSDNPSIKDLTGYLVNNGLDPAVALGLAVNAEGETWKGSGLIKSSAVNAVSGASGIFQWLGPRLSRFKDTHGGLSPHQTSWQTQVDFLLNDSYERSRLNSSVRGANGPYQIAQAINDRFEANGLPLEGTRRAALAAQLSSAYGGTNGAGIGQQVNIQSMTVQANRPDELAGGLQRINSTQNYNSAVK